MTGQAADRCGVAMNASELFELRENLRQRGIVFAYSGYVTENVLSGVGDALKQKLAIEDAKTQTMRSVFAVFVEQMQNIIRYSAEQLAPARVGTRRHETRELRYGILTIGQEGADYVVHAGNLVSLLDVPRMRTNLAAIRAMTRDELKAAYKDQLRSDPEESSKGAGVGFLEIARRASAPIEFDFMDVDGERAFFALKAKI